MLPKTPVQTWPCQQWAGTCSQHVLCCELRNRYSTLALLGLCSATPSQHARVPDSDDSDDEVLASTPPKRHAGLRKAVSDTMMELSAELDGKLCADTDDEQEEE